MSKIYFASDQHFGAPNKKLSQPREQLFVSWLDCIKADATELFLLGDLFDFWFEYKTVVPRGFIRVLGKLAELKDKGIAIHFFVGNHDLWMTDYFEKELGVSVYHSPKTFERQNKSLYIAHGDGLGPGDNGYKFLKKIFTNPVCKWLFRWLHPDVGVGLAQYLSTENKAISGEEDVHFLGEDKEFLILHSKDLLKEQYFDYFIYGHRHLPMTLALDKGATYVNTGDWITYFTYGVLEKGEFQLKTFEN